MSKRLAPPSNGLDVEMAAHEDLFQCKKSNLELNFLDRSR